MDFANLDLAQLSTYGGAQNAPTSATAPDTLPQTTDSSPSILNSLTGFLGKAADTALDVYSMKEAGKVAGTVYPTGQQNPAAVASAAGNQTSFNWKPWAIGGGALVAVVLVLAVIRRK